MRLVQACTTHEGSLALDPELGDLFLIRGPVLISTRKGDRASGPKVRFDPRSGGRGLTIELPNLALLVTPPKGQVSFEICEP